MNIMEEQFIKPKKVDKNKRARTIIIVFIVILLIALIAMSVMLVVIQKSKLTVKFNGQINTTLKNMITKGENEEFLIPIRDIASYFNYQSFNGNYTNKSEDTKQCYIETTDEVVEFTVGSNKIEKIDKNTMQTTSYNLDQEVKMLDGKLYTTMDGISKAYNALFTYNKEKNLIAINTMENLIEIYENKIIEQGYKEISKKFNDEKAILQGLVIVQDEQKNYGVIDLDNNYKPLLECKYTSIQYMPLFKEFLVENNQKFGIISVEKSDLNAASKAEEKIKVQYDSIELMDQELKYYLVKDDGQYGVIDQKENSIIPIKFDQIGIDIKKFSKNNIKNKYILLDNLIPVERNNKWRFYNLGEKGFTDETYDSLGRTASKTSENVLIIPEQNIIIGYRDKNYILIDENGDELLKNISIEDVYMDVDNDEIKYILVSNKKEYDAIEVLEKIKNKNKNTSNSSSSSKTNTSTDEDSKKTSNTTNNDDEDDSEEDSNENESDEEDEDEEAEDE